MSIETVENLKESHWGGGAPPMKASYGKTMMWYFLISDTFTFVAFLVSYATVRMVNAESWPKASKVFSSIPIPGFEKFHELPLVFVSIMTFILIISSVTMVRAVQEGSRMNRAGVIRNLLPTIGFGILFLLCQYFEWTHLMHDGMTLTSMPAKFAGENGTVAYQFGSYFFIITGFHGLHVFGGVILNLYLLLRTTKGDFDRLGHYEMVEKIGLYWHFVDLVWVYVFLAFYLM
ncbi:MAG: cytochrome c oxidase subunit 3 [Chitinophagales bacterium]|jgi:cytochrome c oxidase subunit 3|nr:cytochrome c oxidase subunit 3 [Sphingobacteriales bacterium]